MNIHFLSKGRWADSFMGRHLFGKLMMRTMMLTKIILLCTALAGVYASVPARAQTITLTLRDASFKAAIEAVGKQTQYGFTYNAKILEGTGKVNVELKDASLEQALEQLFRGQPLRYEIADGIIIVERKGGKGKPGTREVQQMTVRGKVTDSIGNALQGVTVLVKGTNRQTSTDRDGVYELAGVSQDASILFRLLSYETLEVRADKPVINVVLTQTYSFLDEPIVIGYGTTSRRLATGNVSKVSGEVISQQPVTNPLQALAGRAAGLEIVQSNGLPGSPIRVRIRGRNSIGAGNNPLYIIDGVPFTSDPIESLGGPQGDGTSSGNPMNAINPSDIESIEVLKDADATAIYGSRASNGVILITTKKATPGDTHFDVGVRSGFSRVSRLADVLTTSEYLRLRNDALVNSGMTPDAANAPDLILWDKSVDGNWPKWYMGGEANTTDASIAFSGGKERTTFLFSGGYHNESTVLQGNTSYQRGSARLNTNHKSVDNKFSFTSSIFYITDKNLLSGNSVSNTYNISRFIPNYPTFDADGNFNWTANKTNPIAAMQAYYKSRTNSLNGNTEISYTIGQDFLIRASLGYNRIDSEEVRPSPIISMNPSFNPTGGSTFGNRTIQTFLVEPQILYDKTIDENKISLLVGSTIQSTNNVSNFFLAQGYTNDLLLESLNYGTILFKSSNSIIYRYLSIFGRINYRLKDKYLVNLNLRRDGSSRFGPGNQFGNFASIGAAWVFTDEIFVQEALPWLSYGKVRGSYGITGNDAIRDYSYLNLYANTNMYGSENAIRPSQIPNPNFKWEVNRKMEVGLELSIFNDFLHLATSWYRNRSGNQLIGFALPSMAGFTSYQANLPALVENKGWEFELNTHNVRIGGIKWNSSLNLSLPKNKLLEFPGLESSSYANSLIVGQPLSIVQRYNYMGTDPETGLAKIEDINGDGVFTPLSSYNSQPGDFIIAGHTDPKLFGGFTNSFQYRDLLVDLTFQYVNQVGYNGNIEYGTFGMIHFNPLKYQLDYWKNPGDLNVTPKPFANSNQSNINFGRSNATLNDASFLRLKNVSISYSFPSRWLSKINLRSVKMFVQGQNLWTATSFKDFDPESAWIGSASTGIQVPNLKTVVIGTQISL